MVSGSFTRSLWGLSITLIGFLHFESLMLGSHFCVPLLGKLWIVNSYISLATRAIVGTWNWMTDSDIISGSRIWKFVVEYDVQSQGDGVVAIAWFNHTFTSIPNPRPANITNESSSTFTHNICISAMHICTPDTPFYWLRRSVMSMRPIKSKNWCRFSHWITMHLKWLVLYSFKLNIMMVLLTVN